MRVMRFMLVVGIVLSMGLIAVTISAQEDELTEQELIHVSYLEAAFQSLNELNSFTIDGKQSMLMTMSMPEGAGTLDAQIALAWQIVPQQDGNIEAAAGSATMTLAVVTAGTDAPEEMSMVMTADTIFLDMKQYFHITIESEDEDLNGAYPDMWFEIDMADYIAEMEQLNGGAIDLDFETLSGLVGNEYTSKYVIPVNVDTVRSITEEDSVTRDDVTYRVFSMDIDPRGTIPAEFSSVVTMAELYAEAGLAGDSPEAGILANLSEILDNLIVQQVIWVDTSTGLPARVVLDQDYSALFDVLSDIDSTMDIDSGQFRLTSDVELIDIDAPFTVEPPDDTFPIPASSLME